MLKRNVLFFLPLAVLLFACGGSPAANTGVSSGPMPEWVNAVDSVYPRSRYAAGVGFDSNRAVAERNAIANLTAFFGQEINVDRTAASSYRQAVTDGVTDSWVNTAEMSTVIRTLASMDNLLGAEVKEVWQDPRGTYYAVAVMEKTRSAQLYNEMIQANLQIINNLTGMPASEKNTLDGVIRYRFAAVAADVNTSYATIVRLLDAAPPQGLLNGDHYRLEAQNIVRAVPIGITVANDRSGRIFGAFAKCFSELGFETTSGNSRHMLNVNVTLSRVELNNPNIFSRIELTANLTDTNLGIVLLPYNFNLREGHTSLAEAENRCIASAERKINEEYKDLLSEYLSKLMPKN